jgi:hypothetical protein
VSLFFRNNPSRGLKSKPLGSAYEAQPFDHPNFCDHDK